MGNNKKQGRNNNKKKTKKKSRTIHTSTTSGDALEGNNSASGPTSGVGFGLVDGVHVAATTIPSTTTTTVTCYHGSTAEDFAIGSDFQKAMSELISLFDVFTPGEEFYTRASFEACMSTQRFVNKHTNLIQDPKFIQHLFSSCTDMYLHNYGSDNGFKIVANCLNLAFAVKYNAVEDREKKEKYIRDIQTERGIMKCLARETSSFCQCMDAKKAEANAMDKVGKCMGCKNEFRKIKLSV